MKIRGYEIYKLTGGGYRYRQIIDFCFTEDEAKAKIEEHKEKHGKLHYGVIYFTKVDGVWKRIYVSEVPKVILDKLNEK